MIATRTCSSTMRLLPSGWARDVRIDRRRRRHRRGRGRRHARRRRAHRRHRRSGPAEPALPRLPARHGRLAERRGPAADSFWTWREVMYRFLGRLTPDDVEAIAAFAYMEMLEAGFTTVGEFHYLHHDVDGRPYADLGEMAARIAAASARRGIGLTLLPSFYAYRRVRRRARRPPASGAFSTIRIGFSSWSSARARSWRILPAARVGIAPHSLRAVTPETLRVVCEATPDGPIHIHAAEQTKEVERVPRRARPPAGRMAARQGAGRFPLVPDPRHPHDRARDSRAGGIRRGRRPLPAHRGVARRRHFRCRELSRRWRPVRHRHRFQYPDRCGGGIAAAGIWPAAHAARPQCADRARGGIDRTAAVRHGACRRCAGAAAADRRARIRSARGYRAARREPSPISRRGTAMHGSMPGFSSAGRDAVKTVLVGGATVVEAGRHKLRPAIEARYRAAVAGITT